MLFPELVFSRTARPVSGSSGSICAFTQLTPTKDFFQNDLLRFIKPVIGTRQEGEEFNHTGTKHLEAFVTAKLFIDFQIISLSESWFTCLGAHTC